MRAVLTTRMSAPVGIVIGRSRPGLVARLRDLLAAYRRAHDAASTYAKLKPMSDAALAQHNLTRADIPRTVLRELTRKE